MSLKRQRNILPADTHGEEHIPYSTFQNNLLTWVFTSADISPLYCGCAKILIAKLLWWLFTYERKSYKRIKQDCLTSNKSQNGLLSPCCVVSGEGSSFTSGANVPGLKKIKMKFSCIYVHNFIQRITYAKGWFHKSLMKSNYMTWF